MKMIVGLGNPGTKYASTRHNIGFDILDKFAEKFNIKFDKNKFNSSYATSYINNQKYLLIKPNTYMNLSGEAVRSFCDYFDVDIDDILVIYDDLDTKTANFRLRGKGSSGGHNGMKNIILHLGTEKINRLKIGIDRPTNNMKVADYVLSKFSEEERKQLEEIYPKCINCIEDFGKYTFIELMNKYN